MSFAGNLMDPVSFALTPVAVGDQVKSIGAGNLSSNFVVVNQNASGAVDFGVPSKWEFPQVSAAGSKITLDWGNNSVSSAIQYFVWGRTAGTIGIVATLAGNVLTFTDDGTVVIVPIPVTAVSLTPIRYNALGSLTVNAAYAGRQSSATFPVRDTLN
jgi:hypothetical protein